LRGSLKGWIWRWNNHDVTGDVPLIAALTADLSRSRSNDLLNSENEKQYGNHGQNRLRITINHDLFLHRRCGTAKTKRNPHDTYRSSALGVQSCHKHGRSCERFVSMPRPIYQARCRWRCFRQGIECCDTKCAKLQQSGLDAATRLRVNHAASDLSDEQRHRQKSH
jgi:hypothetical protein